MVIRVVHCVLSEGDAELILKDAGQDTPNGSPFSSYQPMTSLCCSIDGGCQIYTKMSV